MMSDLLKEKLTKVHELIANFAVKVREGADANVLGQMTEYIDDAVVAYNTQSKNETYSTCLKDANPMLAVVRQYTWEQMTLRSDKSGKVLTGFTPMFKDVPIDLLDFIKYAQLMGYPSFGKGISGKIAAMSARLNERNATKVGYSADEMKRVTADCYEVPGAKAYDFTDKEIGVPLTNTQMCKMLQEVVDTILFLPGDVNPAKNKLRINNADVFVFKSTYSALKNQSKSRSDCVIVDKDSRRRDFGVKSTKELTRIMFEIVNRLVTEGRYNVVYRAKKERNVPKELDSKADESKTADPTSAPATDESKPESKPEAKTDAEPAPEQAPADPAPAEPAA